MSPVVSIVSSITFGPLQGTRPSVGGGVLAISIGVSGIAYVSLNLLAGKARNVSKWKIAFGFAVLLFFIANGIMQILSVR